MIITAQQVAPDLQINQAGIGPIVTLAVGPNSAPAVLADAPDGGMPLDTDLVAIVRDGTLKTVAFPAVRGAVSVLDYGAIEGGADCTEAFLAAWNAAVTQGVELEIPGGHFWLNTPLAALAAPVGVRGQGAALTHVHLNHNGIGFDVAPASVLAGVSFRDLTFWAEDTTAPTAAAVRVTYPVQSSGYTSAVFAGVEVRGYPNSANGLAPFPQTFTRGIVLVSAWKARLLDCAWFGPPAVAGATSASFLEINGCYDTRLIGCAAQYGASLVVQSGYGEGLYLINPVVIGCDYVFTQTAQTGWTGYVALKTAMLGTWCIGGELNTALGHFPLTNCDLGFVIGCDITRDTGPATAQVLCNFLNVSRFKFCGCDWTGNPGGVDVAIQFAISSGGNSSGCTVPDGHFQNMATIVGIVGASGTVGLWVGQIHTSNVSLATAFIDPTPASNGNHIAARAPAGTTYPAGTMATKDHVLNGPDGSPVARFKAVAQATDYPLFVPASTGGSATVAIETEIGGLAVAPANGALFLPNIPTSPTGLTAGQVWRNGNALMVV